MTEHRGSKNLNKKPQTKRERETTVAFARVLAAARTRKRLTRTQMAALYGAAPTVITRIESGRCMIGEATIRRYAKALGMRVELKLVQKRRRA